MVKRKLIVYNYYITKDLYSAAFLLINGFSLINITSENGVVFFHFDYTKDLKELVLNYFSKHTSVEPIRFIDEIKQLRHLIRDTLRQKIFIENES